MPRAKKQSVKVTGGSGNVYADLGHPFPEEMLLKAKLSMLIYLAIKKQGLTQKQAAVLMGLDQPRVSAIINGRLDGISVERLMRFLQALGVDVFAALQRDLDRMREELQQKVA